MIIMRARMAVGSIGWTDQNLRRPLNRLRPGVPCSGVHSARPDASLHVVLIEDIGTLGVLRLLPRLMGSGELRTSRVKRWRAQHVRLTTDRPCMFHGDGEILGPTPVEIEVVPRAVQVWAPVRP